MARVVLTGKKCVSSGVPGHLPDLELQFVATICEGSSVELRQSKWTPAVIAFK